jgi:transposase
MNSTQNQKITQITSTTLIIGVDIAKFKHVARAQDFRGVEFGKPIAFENSLEGFQNFINWFRKIMLEHEFKDVLVGMEPTGHYWLNLVHYLKEHHISCGVVNPLHVKKSKELDDNSPTKNDVKDAKVIAQLVKDGRYAIPNIPQGIYAELREAMKIRDHLSTDLRVVQGRVHNWLDRYFPEFLTVFKDWECKSAIQMLSLSMLPQELVLAIKGIGRDTVAGFLAEVGDIANYHHPKQIVKLAGLNLQENTSGKHKGQAKITKRGRRKLRALLFRVIMPLVAKNQAFKALHEYYTKRPDNPLKKMQSLIALCSKLIRILFGIMKKGHVFSESKMLQDIPRFSNLELAA